MDNAAILTSNGFVNVASLISAASSVGLELAIAVAFAEAESHGANVYGHDKGGTFYGAGTVTETNFREFYDLVVNKHHTSNGVGPMQITWSGFFPDAARKGYKLWLPLDNFRYGFGLIKGYLAGSTSDAAIASAGKRYNGSAAYGQRIVSRVHVWRKALAGSPTPAPGPSPAPVVTTYTVKAGDTLSGIAARFHVTVAQLVAWNHIANPDLIYPSQRLSVHAASGSTKTYYTVVAGDTLTAIATKYNTSVAQLVKWNSIKNADLIYPGQKLRVR